MKDIDKALLNNSDFLEKTIINSLEKENFGVLEKISYKFHPQGFTLLTLLSESHLAIHTYPEHNCLYFNMYSCRGPEDSKNTFESIKKALNPKKIDKYNDSQVSLI